MKNINKHSNLFNTRYPFYEITPFTCFDIPCINNSSIESYIIIKRNEMNCCYKNKYSLVKHKIGTSFNSKSNSSLLFAVNPRESKIPHIWQSNLSTKKKTSLRCISSTSECDRYDDFKNSLHIGKEDHIYYGSYAQDDASKRRKSKVLMKTTPKSCKQKTSNNKSENVVSFVSKNKKNSLSSHSSNMNGNEYDPPSLQKYYRTELLSSYEEYRLGIQIQFLMRCERVHEGLSLQLGHTPSISV